MVKAFISLVCCWACLCMVTLFHDFMQVKLQWYFIEAVHPRSQPSHHPGTVVLFLSWIHTYIYTYEYTHTHHKSSQHVYGSTWINKQPASGHQESILQHIERTQGKNKAAPWLYIDSHTHARMPLQYSAKKTHLTHTHNTHTHNCHTQWMIAVMLGTVIRDPFGANLSPGLQWSRWQKWKQKWTVMHHCHISFTQWTDTKM